MNEQRLTPARAKGQTTEKPKWNRAERRAFMKRLPRAMRAAVKRGEVKL